MGAVRPLGTNLVETAHLGWEFFLPFFASYPYYKMSGWKPYKIAWIEPSDYFKK